MRFELALSDICRKCVLELPFTTAGPAGLEPVQNRPV